MTDTATFFREVAVEVSHGDGRTLVSRLVPYNEVATVDDGSGPYQEEFLPGAFDGQTRAANRIKAFLNFRHRQGIADMIGHATKIEDRNDGLHGELRVLEGANGDTALQLVEAGMLDRLSIEFEPLKDRVVNGVTQRVKARLLGVALVTQGAYSGAEVLAVREEPDPEDPPEDEPAAITREQIELPPPLDVERLEALGMKVPARERAAMPMGMSEMPAGVKACTEAGKRGYMGGDTCHMHDGSQASMTAAMNKAKQDAGKAG